MLPIPAPTSPQPHAKQPIPPAKFRSRPGCSKAGSGMGSFRCGLPCSGGGPGQERSGTTLPRSETGSDFAARSGSSLSGNRCRPCAGPVSAVPTCRTRGTAGLRPNDHARSELPRGFARGAARDRSAQRGSGASHTPRTESRRTSPALEPVLPGAVRDCVPSADTSGQMGASGLPTLFTTVEGKRFPYN